MPDGGAVAPERVKQGGTGSRYAAFISYNHADEEIANWLHKRLESYAIPKALAGEQQARRIGKVFRDRVELSASHDLGGEIRKALDQSDALIVLCSPKSAKSRYVEEEIRYFKALGRGERVFAAIVSGEPHAAGKPWCDESEECFPRALLYRVGQDGGLSAEVEPNEPLAADVRIGRDGRESGALKLIAGLIGVGLDELVQREKQAERERRRRSQFVAAAMGVLALGAMGAGGYAWWQEGVASRERDRATSSEALAIVERDNAHRERLLSGIAADEQLQITEILQRQMGIEFRRGTDGSSPGSGPRVEKFESATKEIEAVRASADRRRDKVDQIKLNAEGLSKGLPTAASELTQSILDDWRDLGPVRASLISISFYGSYEEMILNLSIMRETSRLDRMYAFFGRFGSLGPSGQLDSGLLRGNLDAPTLIPTDSIQWWAANFFPRVSRPFSIDENPPPADLSAALCGLVWLGLAPKTLPITPENRLRCSANGLQESRS